MVRDELEYKLRNHVSQPRTAAKNSASASKNDDHP